MARKKIWLIPVLVWLVISLTSCGMTSSTNYNGLKGSAQLGGGGCKGGSRQGECSGVLNKLNGTFYKSIDIESLQTNEPDLVLEAVVSVGSGTVIVYVYDSAGQQHAVEVKAGETASLVGMASAMSNDFMVFFEAVGGEADQVKYTVRYAAGD